MILSISNNLLLEQLVTRTFFEPKRIFLQRNSPLIEATTIFPLDGLRLLSMIKIALFFIPERIISLPLKRIKKVELALFIKRSFILIGFSI